MKEIFSQESFLWTDRITFDNFAETFFCQWYEMFSPMLFAIGKIFESFEKLSPKRCLLICTMQNISGKMPKTFQSVTENDEREAVFFQKNLQIDPLHTPAEEISPKVKKFFAQ